MYEVWKIGSYYDESTHVHIGTGFTLEGAREVLRSYRKHVPTLDFFDFRKVR